MITDLSCSSMLEDGSMIPGRRQRPSHVLAESAAIVAARSLLLVAAEKTSPLCIDIFKNLETEHLDELRENLIRAKPCRVIIDSRRDD